jgi:hypothetical protein
MSRVFGPLLVGSAILLSGCLERTVTVTSDPPGAVVWLNDAEIGRTPVTTAFDYYGEYDVRLRREGREPLVTTKELRAPLYEYPPVDLVALAVPLTIHSHWNWHYTLPPQAPVEGQAEADLIARARDMQAEVTAPEAAPAPPAPPPPATRP